MKSSNTYAYQADRLKKVADQYLAKIPRLIAEVGVKDAKETLAFHALFPEADIHSFECDPRSIAMSRGRIGDKDRITLHETAVSDTVGELEFYSMPNSPGSSSAFILGTDSFPELLQEKLTVPCTTLEDALVRAPDILWMDAQGSELNVLKGAGDLLTDISLIHTEVYFQEAYIGQPLYKDIRNYLETHGFELLLFSSQGRNFADAIFVNRNVYRRKFPRWVTEWTYTLNERIVGHARGLVMRLRHLLRI